MTKTTAMIDEGVETQPLKVFTEKAYLDYSMYVIMDRALPNIGDGLKPVQRRIIYAMSELGLKATAKYKKSARTIGDVLGKFHPHGDSACYEAMVLMAQSFSYRYPLVDGQGNWGSADDPKSFAAMRYTEAKLSPYAHALLAELGQATVQWTANFDGTLQEPCILPACVPNILLNGGTGIAVGMATDIPPHNLTEIVAACVHLLENPKATVDELCQHVQGPDFPTEAEIITPKADLLKLYRTGHGSLRMRAVYHQEQNGDIVITALPYQASGAKILEQIATQMRAKKLPMVVDLRDESDHENPTRLVIEPRSNRVDIQAVMGHLFVTTDLERSYRVNLNMIGVNGKPEVKNLATILHEWLSFRVETVRKRLQFRLDKVNTRLHILDGLLIAFLNIDEVIQIIREADDPKKALMEKFQLSVEQTDAILDLKLRYLARLEEIKIKSEQQQLAEERQMLEKILASNSRLKTLVKKELRQAAAEFGDERKSPVVERQEAVAIKQEDIIPSEPITVVLSHKGWVRAAKGHEVNPESLNYKSGDGFKAASQGRSLQQAIFFDNTGRVYSLKAHSLPSARGQGEPLTGRFNPPAGAIFEGVLMGEPTQLCLVASNAGYGFIVPLAEMISKNKAGKSLLKLPTGAKALTPCLVNDVAKDLIAAVTNEGRLLLFPIKELPQLTKGKGNKIINIPSASFKNNQEFVVDIAVMGDKQVLKLFAGRRHLTLKLADLEHYLSERGRRGHKLPRGYQKVDKMESVDKSAAK